MLAQKNREMQICGSRQAGRQQQHVEQRTAAAAAAAAAGAYTPPQSTMKIFPAAREAGHALLVSPHSRTVSSPHRHTVLS
jgi:hypothetical protein